MTLVGERRHYYSMKNKSSKNNYSLDFCNRVDELATLQHWVAESPRLAIIHGRRRLGKTRLLGHWCAQVRSCYVLATEGTATSQRAAFAEDLAAVVPNFGDVTYPNWRALFRSLAAQWPRDDRPCVLVIDELPYLAKSSPDLPSVLQGLVDDPECAHLPLVLCGSSQRMMQGLVLDAAAPLYGRAQCLLRIQPLSMREIGPALGVDDPTQVVETYAAWGGVPRYWELAALLKLPLWDSVTQLVLMPSGVLHEEGSRILRDEEAAALERAVCQAIGLGAHRPSEISGRLGVRSTTLAKPLRNLVELGLVRRDAPYDFSKGRSKQLTRSSLYALADPFLSMWYRCVHPYLSGLELGTAAATEHSREAWRHHVGAVWEQWVRLHWHHLALNGFSWEAAGRYWEGRKFTGQEWDVVSVTADRRQVMLGECKWHRTISNRDLSRFAHEIRTKSRPPAVVDRSTIYCLFLPSRTRFPEEIEGVRLIDVDDLLKTVPRA